MTSPAGVFVLYIQKRVRFEEIELFFLEKRQLPEGNQQQLYLSIEDQFVSSPTARVHEEVFLAILFGVFILVAIALMEAESRKLKDLHNLPYHKGEKENIEMGNKCSQHFDLKRGFLKKSWAPEKSRILPLIDFSKSAEPIDIGNVTHVFKMSDKTGNPIAIFKPFEGEFDYPNSNEMKLSFPEYCKNEVATYKIDQLVSSSLRAGVPETSLAKVPSMAIQALKGTTVRGSLQRYESNAQNAADYGSGVFSIDDIHRIGVLDLKILNCDRHSGNILISSDTKKLIPIDHALAFPEVELTTPTSEGAVYSLNAEDGRLLLKNVSFDWLLYPQAKVPFTDSELREIASIDISEHVKLLSKMGMTMKQMLATYSSLLLLKEAAIKQNRTLYEIGCMIQRQGRRDRLSTLEILVDNALAKCDKTKIQRNDIAECKTYCKHFKLELSNFFKV